MNIKKILFIGVFLINILAITANAKMPIIKEFNINNIKGLLVEDHYLPIISYNLVFNNVGSAYDEKDKQGIAELFTGLLSEGSGEYNAYKFRERLQELTSQMSFSSDRDNIYISVKTLKDNLFPMLELTKLVLSSASFNPEDIDRIKKQIYILLKRQEESPNEIAQQAFNKVFFADHPYGQNKYGSKETLANIKKDDLSFFLKNKLTKANLTLNITGDIKYKDLTKITSYFKDLPEKFNFKKLPKVNPIVKGQTIKINKDIPQSIILFATNAVGREAKEFYPAYMMNHILGGGGFESILTQKVREEKGLVYSIYSYIDAYRDFGIYKGLAATSNKNVDKALEIIKLQIRNLKDNLIEAKALQDSKNYVINSFPLRMTKNENITSYLNIIADYNLGIDFFQKRNSYVDNVSLHDVNNVAKNILDINKFIIVIVGK